MAQAKLLELKNLGQELCLKMVSGIKMLEIKNLFICSYELCVCLTIPTPSSFWVLFAKAGLDCEPQRVDFLALIGNKRYMPFKDALPVCESNWESATFRSPIRRFSN